MKDQVLSQVLKVLLSKIKDQDITWRLEGSVNLLVQGVPVEPNDVDITTNTQGLKGFVHALKEYTPKLTYVQEKGAYLLHCSILKNDVEIAVYEDHHKEMLGFIEKTHWKGLDLPTLPIAKAREFYEAIGRTEKVELIDLFLDV